MSTQTQKKLKLYETLILVEQAAIASDPEGVSSHIQEILDRADAKVLTLYRWDERKLQHTIKKQTRGTFVRALFKVNPQQISVIEREFNLSDQVLRAMFIHADYMGETEIEQTIEAGKTAADKAKLQKEAQNSEEQSQEETANEDKTVASEVATETEDSSGSLKASESDETDDQPQKADEQLVKETA